MPALMIPGVMPPIQPPTIPFSDFQKLAARKYPYELKSSKPTPTYVSPDELQLTWTSSVEATPEPDLTSNSEDWNFHQTTIEPDDALLDMLVRKYMDLVYWPDEKLDTPRDSDHGWMRHVIGEYYRLKGDPHKGGDKPHKGGDKPHKGGDKPTKGGDDIVIPSIPPSIVPADLAPVFTIVPADLAPVFTIVPADPAPAFTIVPADPAPAFTIGPAAPAFTIVPADPAPALTILVGSRTSDAPAVQAPAFTTISLASHTSGAPAFTALGTTIVAVSAITGAPALTTPAPGVSLTTLSGFIPAVVSIPGTPLTASPASLISLTGMISATGTPLQQTVETVVSATGTPLATTAPAAAEKRDEPEILQPWFIAPNRHLTENERIYGKNKNLESRSLQPSFIARNRHLAENEEIDAENELIEYVRMVYEDRLSPETTIMRDYPKPTVDDAFLQQISDIYAQADKAALDLIMARKEKEFIANEKKYNQRRSEQIVDPTSVEDWEEVFAVPEEKEDAAPEKEDAAEPTEGDGNEQTLDRRHEMEWTIRKVEEMVKSRRLGPLYTPPSSPLDDPLEARATGGGTIWG